MGHPATRHAAVTTACNSIDHERRVTGQLSERVFGAENRQKVEFHTSLVYAVQITVREPQELSVLNAHRVSEE